MRCRSSDIVAVSSAVGSTDKMVTNAARMKSAFEDVGLFAASRSAILPAMAVASGLFSSARACCGTMLCSTAITVEHAGVVEGRKKLLVVVVRMHEVQAAAARGFIIDWRSTGHRVRRRVRRPDTTGCRARSELPCERGSSASRTDCRDRRLSSSRPLRQSMTTSDRPATSRSDDGCASCSSCAR